MAFSTVNNQVFYRNGLTSEKIVDFYFWSYFTIWLNWSILVKNDRFGMILTSNDRFEYEIGHKCQNLDWVSAKMVNFVRFRSKMVSFDSILT